MGLDSRDPSALGSRLGVQNPRRLPRTAEKREQADITCSTLTVERC